MKRVTDHSNVRSPASLDYRGVAVPDEPAAPKPASGGGFATNDVTERKGRGRRLEVPVPAQSGEGTGPGAEPRPAREVIAGALRDWGLEIVDYRKAPRRRQLIDIRSDAVAWSPDGKYIVSGLDDKTVRIWDAATGQPIGAPLAGHTGSIESVAVSPNGKYIVSGSADMKVRLWNATTGRPIGAPLTGHKGSVDGVAVTPDSKYVVSGAFDKTVRVWDAATGNPVGVPIEERAYVSSVAVSPDGKCIISGSWDHAVRIWDVTTGQAVGKPLEGHTGAAWKVAVSPDGKYIVSGSGENPDSASGQPDNTVRLWDAATGKPIGAPLTGHTDLVLSVAVSPDGQYIVSGSRDGTVLIWDAATGQPVGAPLLMPSAALSVAFDKSGARIVVGYGNGVECLEFGD